MQRLVVFVIFAPFLFAAAQHYKLYPEPDTNTADYRNRFQHNRQGISYRLPNDTIPLHYDISLHTRIDVPDFNFNGIVTIRLRVVTATRVITMHSKQQTIISVNLQDSTGQTVPTQEPSLDPVTEFLVITTTAQELPVGAEYTLTITYTAILRTDDEGFYRSAYIGDDGQRVWQAATQFQESDARHGFPCYDEPALRTNFSIRITHGERYHALSNMPIKDIVPNNDQTQTTYFEDITSMQTYLVAFLVSDFISISNAATKQPDELLQSVYGQPRVIRNGEGDFALEAGIKIMHKMEEYFGFPYTFPKMDQVGVPDFSAGAMENWGLAKYRESLLYYDNGTSPFQQLDWVGTIISHEYAHQWFGNLISPRWWDVLWINEGFATMYEYLSTDAVYPEWRIHDLMVVGTLQTVMERDALPSSRPMTYYVESQADVRNLFDFVAYSKSGCVLRMLQHIMTDATFRKGLNYYIVDMQYKTAEPDDLYRNLLRAAREDNVIPTTVTIKQIMDSWANQMGFPMIRVSREAHNVIRIEQAHFLLQGTVPNEQTWWIPINFASKSQPDFSQTTPMHWLMQGGTSMTVPPSNIMAWSSRDWLVFNKHQTGYYRVNYDETLWQQVIDELVDGNYTIIPVINRAQLIDDAFAFARVNQVPYSTLFGLLEYLSHELDYAPWAPASRALTAIDRRMASWANYYQFQTFVHNKVQPLFESLGVGNLWNDTYFDRLARNVAIRWACYVGSTECLDATNARLKTVINSGGTIEADVRSTIFCNGLRHAGENDFMAIWVRLTSTTMQVDRNMLIDSLGCSQDFELISSLLVSTIATTNVNYSTAERVRILNAAIQGGIVGVRAVLQFLDRNLLQVITVYPLGSVINNLAPWIGNQELMTQFMDLTTRLVIAGQISHEARNNAMQTAQANLQWATDYGTDINEWLNRYIDRSNDGALVQVLPILLGLGVLLLFINL